MNKNNLKIAFLGFDWRNLASNDFNILLRKLDRDGLNTKDNHFFVLYAGGKTGRVIVREKPLFIAWHVNLLIRFRLIYDFIFIFLLPLALLKERYKPDIFYTTDFAHVFSTWLPARLLGAKIYFRLINLPTKLALTKGLKGRIYCLYYFLLEKLTIPLVDKFVVINKTTKKYLIERGVKQNLIFQDFPDTILVDKQIWEKLDHLTSKKYLQEKYNLSFDKKIILSVGSLIKEKGFSELINSFSELQREDLVLLIAGEGEEKDRLSKLIVALNAEDKVFFVGKLNRTELWRYYYGADIFCLFSKSESLGMVFWEAMIAGIPVIGTDSDGVLETIGDDGLRGYLLNNQKSDFGKKIDLCLEEGQSKKDMLERAREFVLIKMQDKLILNDLHNR